MFALIYQINFWQRKNMSDKNCLLSNTLSMKTKSKGFLLQYQNELQGNLGTENKSKVSKKSGKIFCSCSNIVYYSWVGFA